MYTYTKDNKDQPMFKVIAKQKSKIIADYRFHSLKSATQFYLGMLKKGYIATLERI